MRIIMRVPAMHFIVCPHVWSRYSEVGIWARLRPRYQSIHGLIRGRGKKFSSSLKGVDRVWSPLSPYLISPSPPPPTGPAAPARHYRRFTITLSSMTHHTRFDSAGRVISPMLHPLPDQHTTLVRDGHSCPGRGSNQKSQQASGHRPRGHYNRPSYFNL